MINKNIADKIASQSIDEIQFARTYKQSKIANWQKNEDMYYSKKIKSIESRANVNLARMQEFVHTILSKIDNPLVFKFEKRKEAQVKRVKLLNALRQVDQQNDNWDIKDIVGKKQAIIYGRTIYSYYADSINGYKAHLEPIDVYDFLIDPSCGGLDIERAFYMGYYNIVKTSEELKEGVKNKLYHSKQVEELLQSNGNADESSQEENNKKKRAYDISTTGNKEISEQDNTKFKFWNWFTTYQGKRYYIVLTNSGKWIRCELLDDVFMSNIFPIWSWACFPDLTEFWTPSYCDYVREIFMAQDVSINQMLDNAEAINKPMKVVDTGAIEDLAELKYRRDGFIKSKGGYDVNKALQVLQTPSINTPIQVFNILESIQERSSGVTAGAAGVADEEGKVGIYEGNQVATADRFGLLNKSYSFGYKRFAKLYEEGVKEHLTKKVAVQIVGPNGIETIEVNKRDLFKKGDNYGVLIEASNAEETISVQEKRTKIEFLKGYTNNQTVNQKKLFEMEASIAGLSETDIRQLLDVSEFGNESIMSEAERDIELIISGEPIKPNRMANIAYKQRLVNYLQDNEENMTDEQFKEMEIYIQAIDDIVLKNTMRAMTNNIINQPMPNEAGQPVQPIIGQV